MPIRFGPSCVLLLMMALLVSCAPQAEQEETPTPTPVDEEAAVRAVVESWDPMMNSGDLDGIVSLFAQDAVGLNAGTPPAIGSEAIRKSFQEEFDAARFDSSNPVDEIGVVDDWAFARGTYTNRATDKASGETSEDIGKWVSVFRKTSEGWKLAIDIWNRDAPSTAAMDLEAERQTPVLPEAITTGRNPDEEAVLAATEAWDTAHNTDDIDALMGLYTADAHRMNPDEPDQVGLEAIRTGFEKELAGVKIEGAAQVFGIRVAGDWASVWGTWSATESDDETNEQMEDGGNWLGIMKRTPEGWEFYLDIWNRDA